MTIPLSIPCQLRECTHLYAPSGPLDDPTWTCEAFPLGLPAEILSGENPHTKAVAGDHGVRFSAKPVTEAKEKSDALALVDFSGTVAELTPMGWRCEGDPTLERILENERRARFIAYTENPVATEANLAAADFKGTVIRATKDKAIPDRIY